MVVLRSRRTRSRRLSISVLPAKLSTDADADADADVNSSIDAAFRPLIRDWGLRFSLGRWGLGRRWVGVQLET